MSIPRLAELSSSTTDPARLAIDVRNLRGQTYNPGPGDLQRSLAAAYEYLRYNDQEREAKAHHITSTRDDIEVRTLTLRDLVGFIGG